jgi:hypothetical protein
VRIRAGHGVLGVRTLMLLVLLAGPTVLAFFTGGYFAEAREWAGVLAWLLVAVSLVTRGSEPVASGRRRLSAPTLLVPAALAALAIWTALSTVWSPIAGDAWAAGQLAFLYLGVLLAARRLLATPAALTLLEPALLAGVAIVIGYGLSERLLPGLLHFSASVSAQGRLEQPLTYWNAMGELAAIGLVLAARLAGDIRRPGWLRASAAALAAPVGMGLYISFSRGALFAGFAGFVTLIVAAPRRAQLWACGVAVAAAVLAAIAAAPFAGVTNLSGRLATREGQGAVALVALAVIAALAALAQHRLGARRSAGSALGLPRRAPWIALVGVCAGLALAIAVGAKEKSGVPISGGANRLVSFQSNRYDYWRVALDAFDHAPIIGVGAGGWSVWWLRLRPYPDGATDTHSLELQTLAELGIVGAALLLAFLGGIAWAAARAHRIDPLAAAGPLAGFVTWLAHSPLDWDWQMPALTAVAIVLAGGLLALSNGEGEAPVWSGVRPGLPNIQ